MHRLKQFLEALFRAADDSRIETEEQSAEGRHQCTPHEIHVEPGFQRRILMLHRVFSCAGNLIDNTLYDLQRPRQPFDGIHMRVGIVVLARRA
jgi:hypothetical protein